MCYSHDTNHLQSMCSTAYIYRIAQNLGGEKLWRIDHYRVLARKTGVGEFTIATISYSSEPGIWLGKTLANDVRFAKFAKVFPHQSFALYGTVLDL